VRAGDGERIARALLGGGDAERWRFLGSERAWAYGAIVAALAAARQAHVLELEHETLRAEAAAVTSALGRGPYGELELRADLEQLVEWGAVLRRLEARRVRSLRDRALRKYYYALAPAVADVAERWPQAARRRWSVPARTRARLAEVERTLEELAAWADPDAGDRGARGGASRAAALVETADGLLGLVARDLGAFAEAIDGLGDTMRLEALAPIVDGLERYAAEHVGAAADRARTLGERAGALAGSAHLRAALREGAAAAPEQRAADEWLAGGAAPDALAQLDAIASFLAAGGGLETARRRVEASVRTLVHRVSALVERLGERTVRLEALRARATAIARIDEREARAVGRWIEELIASAHQVTDLRTGTPSERAAPPRVRRAHEARRARFEGSFVAPVGPAAPVARDLRRRRVALLDALVEQDILAGRDAAALSAAPLGDTTAGAVVTAVREGRRRRREVSFEACAPEPDWPPAHVRLQAASPGEACSLTAPDFVFRRAGK